MEAFNCFVFKIEIFILFVFTSNISGLSPNFPENSPPSGAYTPCDSNCYENNVSNSKSVDFVCGSDGFTYLNFGELDCVRKSCKRDILLKQYGRCPRVMQTLQIQGEAGLLELGQRENQIPVDRNFLRFLSRGMRLPMENQNQQQTLTFPPLSPPTSYGFPQDTESFDPMQKSPKLLLLAVNGRRQGKKVCIPDECNCPAKDLRPICGSDSVTYGNQCLMDCNKECNPDVVKYHDGHCGKLFLKGSCRNDDCGCPDDLQPVCGSDSVTYGNRCLLECSKNCSPDIGYNYDGHCGRLFFSNDKVQQSQGQTTEPVLQ